MDFQPSHAKMIGTYGPMNVMSPSKDALNSLVSIAYWFYYIIMLFGGVRVEKQKGDVTKYHLVLSIIISVFRGPGSTPAGRKPRVQNFSPTPPGENPRLSIFSPTPLGENHRFSIFSPTPSGEIPDLKNSPTIEKKTPVLKYKSYETEKH